MSSPLKRTFPSRTLVAASKTKTVWHSQCASTAGRQVLMELVRLDDLP